MNFIMEEEGGLCVVKGEVRARIKGYVVRESISTKKVLDFLESEGVDISILEVVECPDGEVRNFHGGAGGSGVWKFAKKKTPKKTPVKKPMTQKKPAPKVVPKEE
jgi:hypothetical protein